MKSKPLTPRERADRDIDEAIDFYLSKNAPEAALGFIDALEQAYSHIGHHPEADSSRYAGELNLPGLRLWPLKKYPHRVFNVERSDKVDVWRVLDGQRQVPAWMRDPDLI